MKTIPTRTSLCGWWKKFTHLLLCQRNWLNYSRTLGWNAKSHWQLWIIPLWKWPPPWRFLILDGHGSRFDLLFLEYINNQFTSGQYVLEYPVKPVTGKLETAASKMGHSRWICLEQNEIFYLKRWTQVRAFINKVDIVGLVNTAWEKSFAYVRTDKKQLTMYMIAILLSTIKFVLGSNFII